MKIGPDELVYFYFLLLYAAIFSIFGAIIFWLTNKLIIKRHIAFISRYLYLFLSMVIAGLSLWGTQFVYDESNRIPSFILLIYAILIGIIVLGFLVKWSLRIEFKKVVLISSIVIVVTFSSIYLFLWLMERLF